MKRCSTCQRTYEDDSQKFCANDGTPLVSDEPAPFDPEATVMSLSSQMQEEPAPPPPSPAQPPSPPPNPYYSQSAQPEQNVHQSYPPPPNQQGNAPSPAWPPQPVQQQQPYYPQPGGQQPSPQWQGAGQPPPWMPPGQSPQGQNWGAGAGAAGAYYPQQAGQYAPQATGGRALGLAALIVGLISFITFSLVFGMFMRIIPGDRTVAEFSIYTTLLAGIFGAIIGLITLVSSQRRSKMLGIIGMLISIPGILFFIYIASRYGLR